MLIIHKYPFEIADLVTIAMPKGAKILKFANQNETPVIWALVDTNAIREEVNFLLFGTGHEVPALTNLEYIGSAQFFHGQFVWHLFKL